MEVSTVISLHGGCHLQGSGRGATVIKRATGTLTSSDAAYTGMMIIVTAYGDNGTPNTSANIQSDITISDLTLDGNQSNFGSVNPAGGGNANTPGHMGVFSLCDARLKIQNARIQEFLQTGIQIDEGKDIIIGDVEIYNVGQYGSATSRNGISLLNTSYSVASQNEGHSRGFTLHDLHIENFNDSAIDIVQVNDVAIKNVRTRGGQYIIEMETGSSPPTAWGGVAISNVVSSNNTGQFLRLTSSLEVSNVLVENCHMEGHATLHATGAILFPLNVAAVTQGVIIRGCTFRNINTADTASTSFFKSTANSTGVAKDIIIEDCLFSGYSSSTRTDCNGIEVSGNATRWKIARCILLDVPGVGVYVHEDTNGQIAQDIDVVDVTVDGANNFGWQLSSAGAATGTVKNTRLLGCTAKDCAKQTNNAGYLIQSASGTAGQTVQYIQVLGCRAYKTSGTTMTTGVRLVHSGSSTLDSIWVEGLNAEGVHSAAITASGTPTNIFYTPRTGKGTNITAAATISIPTNGDVFHVTGATNVTNGITVNAYDNGRTVKLIFDSTPTVSDTGTSVLQGDFTAAANDVLCLVCDGTNWYEVSRN